MSEYPSQERARHVGREVVRQSGLTSVAAAASVLSGLLLDVSVAAVYGAGRSTDAFFVAARIPLGLVAILMVGANQALVPAISTWLVKRGERETWRLTSLLGTATLLIGAALAGAVALLAYPLMRITAPGLSTETVGLAASVARVMFIVVPLVGVAEVLRALLNARYSFVAPAAMHVIMNGVTAGLVLAFRGGNVLVIAWAYAAGALAQVVFMLVMGHRRGFRLTPSLALRDPEVTAAGRLCVRPLAGAGLNPLARVGEQLLVSFLPTGSISILNYGYRLVSAIGGSVLFRSVVVVLLPRLTRATASGEEARVRDITRLGLRIMLAVSVPLTALMAVLASPAVLGLFQRGSFLQGDAELLGLVLAVYAGSVIGSGVQRAMLAPFFARLDTRTPLRNTAYGVLANLALVPVLVLPFGRGNERAVLGVAAAYSIAQYVNVCHIWYRLRHDLGMRLTGVGRTLAQLVVATGAMLVVLVVGYRLLELGRPASRWVLLGKTGAVAAAGMAVFGVLAALLGLSDLRRMWSRE